jgi:hypothetical protein
MEAKLSRVVRDKDGFLHKPKERLVITSITAHSSFDPTKILNVKFENGNIGAVFSEEITEVQY